MMDDAEVTRQAIGICSSSLSQMEAFATSGSANDVDILQAYVRLCPFVSSSSPAIQLVVQSLDQVRHQKPDTKNGNDSRRASSSTVPAQEEATRAAMRIAISVWSQLLVQSETMDDRELMQKYIQQCPYVNPNSTVVKAALQGLSKRENTEGTTGTNNVNPPALDNVESDSEDSVSYKERERKWANNNAQSTALNAPNQKMHFRPLIFIFRSIFLDLPMLLLFSIYLGLLWVQRVDQLYLKPSMNAALWTDERAEAEITYYNRECDARDMTTHNSDDLLIPTNATARDAYEHQLLHGFSIFQGVLTEDVMQDLRSYVVSRNRKLSEEESIFVIENDNRFSFGLGTEVPCVARAVEQLATHAKLAPALELILGPNPALIEMTAITSSYGAVNQWWHDDVVATASAMKYGRTFGPSYSVFIQLQNTTKEMGATETCPGSHKCAAGEIETFCDREGFQFVDTSTGYWKAGDALLMNMNSYHRGTAHTDPHGRDRVMLILTFVPKPQEKAESRQMSQGITFSLRWDMWGHTLWDLTQASTRMKQPWATLRALGLYKPKDAAWGVDYVSSAIMRMANEDNGFRRDELETFVERGGFPWLPRWLHGQVPPELETPIGESWHGFLKDTLERCLEFMSYINGIVVGLYVISMMVVFCVSSQRFGSRGFAASLLRPALLYALAYVLWKAANNHVDNTHWAKDIVSGRRYGGVFSQEETRKPALAHLPSTLPHRKDVLIETRYASRQLAMYNDFANNHPGSRYFRELVREYAFAYTLVQSSIFQRATAAYVVGAVSDAQGRFLLQDGVEWLVLSNQEATDFAAAELHVEANPLMKVISQEIRFLESDYKYGYLRDTAIARMSLERLEKMKHVLLDETAIFLPTPKHNESSVQAYSLSLHKKLLAVSITSATSRPLLNHRSRSRVLGVSSKPREPRYGAWLKSGDVIEGTEFLDDGDSHWYKGVLHKVTASGNYYVIYDDASYGILTNNFIRAYKPYFVGEELEVFMGNEDDVVEVCTIVADHKNGTFDVFLDDEEDIIRGVPTGDFRRPRAGKIQSEEKVVRNHYAP